MKKLFTMLVGVLMAGSAFGQKTWTTVVTNGDMEGAPDAEWSSVWVHEWLGDMSERTDGFARIVEDPADPTNHCATVYIRSKEQAFAAGNYTRDYTGNEGTYASWDTQFFIYATEPIPAGKEVRLIMKVKGSTAGFFESQNHAFPGTYIDGNAFGNINFTTEWSTFTSNVITVSESQANSGYQSIAFNVSTTDASNILFFDDIKLQIRDPKEDTSDWINFMRKGIWSDDHITGTSANEGDWECSNFTIQTPEQTKAPVVEVPGEPGVYAVHVPVKGYYIEKVPKLDNDNQPVAVLDPDSGDPVMSDDGVTPLYDSTTVYKWNDGTEIGTSAPQRWTCQFFVSTLHKMKAGERYKFKFKVKADKPTNLGTQAHYGPGKYKDWNTFGAEGDFVIGTDWTTFDLGEAQGKKIPNGADGCQTICFDCVPLEGDNNNFYFIFEECSFTEANVTIADRTLGTPEDLMLPVNSSAEEEMATTIDAAPMLKTFEYTGSLADFMNADKAKEGSSEGIKLSSLTVPDDPEELPEPTFSALMTNWADGGFIDAQGLYIEDDKGIQLRFDDESIDGTKINVNVWNNPDAGIQFGEGKTVTTKLAISQSGWYYVYNVTLMSEGDYAKWLEGPVGDVTGDRLVDVEDVVAIVNQILGEPGENFNVAKADVNGDTKIDVDDVVAVINIILGADAAEAPQLMNILLQNGFKF